MYPYHGTSKHSPGHEQVRLCMYKNGKSSTGDGFAGCLVTVQPHSPPIIPIYILCSPPSAAPWDHVVPIVRIQKWTGGMSCNARSCSPYRRSSKLASRPPPLPNSYILRGTLRFTCNDGCHERSRVDQQFLGPSSTHDLLPVTATTSILYLYASDPSSNM